MSDTWFEETLEQVKKKSLEEYIASKKGSNIISDDGKYSYFMVNDVQTRIWNFLHLQRSSSTPREKK